MGRLLSVERSLLGTQSQNPTPSRRGSSPTADTINVSAPTTSGYLVPWSNPSPPPLGRSVRLQAKPRADYRLLGRSSIWQDRSISEVYEEVQYHDPNPVRRDTAIKTVAGGTTFRCGMGDIASSEIEARPKDVVLETMHVVGPEVRVDLANHRLHPPETDFRVTPDVEESIRKCM